MMHCITLMAPEIGRPVGILFITLVFASGCRGDSDFIDRAVANLNDRAANPTSFSEAPDDLPSEEGIQGELDDAQSGVKSPLNSDGGFEEDDGNQGGSKDIATGDPIRYPVIKTEKFRQTEISKLDVLWVIDNSGSMRPYQESLAKNFEAFIRNFSGTGIDYQLGVTSTDICPSESMLPLEQVACPTESLKSRVILRGQLSGNGSPRVLRANEPNLVEEFSKLALLGTSGSSFEHGLSAARLAVTRGKTGEHTLIRDKSFLAVIIVSDEEDDGVGLSKPNEFGTDYWDRGLTRYKYDSSNLVRDLRASLQHSRFSISSVVSTGEKGSPCESSGQKRIETGAEYLKASDLSGGIKLDICSPDWALKLDQLAKSIEKQLSSFSLKERAVANSIIVRINGEVSVDWSHDSGRNLIIFSQDNLPANGALVEITYRVDEQKDQSSK